MVVLHLCIIKCLEVNTSSNLLTNFICLINIYTAKFFRSLYTSLSKHILVFLLLLVFIKLLKNFV